MILVRLFLTFLMIGTFTFGGGYAMIPLIREQVVANGWLTESQLLTYIAIAESTPGPIAINIATFVGQSQAGLLGVLVAVLGVVLPSFIVILLIAMILKKVIHQRDVQAALRGIKPMVIALITGTGLIFMARALNISKQINTFDWRALIIVTVLLALYLVMKKGFRKNVAPVLLIIIGAGLGIVLYL